MPFTKVRNIAFGGGGVKCIAWGGVILALEELGIWQDVDHIAGTSGGSIAAVAKAIGYSGKEAVKIMFEMDFKQFLNQRYTNFGMGYDLIVNQSLSDGKYFEQWIQQIIQHKTGKPNLTFAELHHLKEEFPNKYEDIILTGIKIYETKSGTKTQYQEYSWKITGDMPIWQAVRISSAFPGLFPIIEGFENIDGIEYNYVLADGGLVTNNPEEIFNYKHYVTNSEGICSNSDTINNKETLCFRLKDDDLTRKQLRINRINILTMFFKASINAPQTYQDNLAKDLMINISNVGVATTDFNIKDSKKLKLIKSGVTGTIDGIAQKMVDDEEFNNYIMQKTNDKFDKQELIEKLHHLVDSMIEEIQLNRASQASNSWVARIKENVANNCVTM